MAASMLGLAAVLHADAVAVQAVEFAGVAYLLYLAFGMWRGAGTLRVAHAGARAGIAYHPALDLHAESDYVDCIEGRSDMASITIRNLEDAVKVRLRIRAAHHGCSMEEEARQILREALREQPAPANLADLAEALFGSNGVELEPHPAVEVREPPYLGP
jgi:antitoxin FitA